MSSPTTAPASRMATRLRRIPATAIPATPRLNPRVVRSGALCLGIFPVPSLAEETIEMVSVALAPLPPEAITAGVKVQANPAGRFGQESAIGLLNEPETALRLTWALAELPFFSCSANGDTETRMPPELSPPATAAHCAVNATGPDIWLRMLAFPTACTYRV